MSKTKNLATFVLLLLALLLLPGALHAQTIPITGHVTSISGSSSQQMSVKFQLTYCQGNVPLIYGTATAAQSVVTFTPDANGLISGSIYPNSVIDCGGYTGGSRYTVTFMNANVPTGMPKCYYILATPTPFNLDSAPTCTVPPVFSSPPGPSDAQVQNLNVLGTLTGTNANFTGNVNVGGTITAQNLPAGGIPVASQQYVGVQSNLGTGAPGAIVGVSGIAGPANNSTASAENGETERYWADFHMAGGTTIPGFDLENDPYTRLNHWNCLACTSGSPAYLVRALQFPGPTSWTVQGTLYSGANKENCIGFNNLPYGQYAGDANESNVIRTCFTTGGVWILDNAGTRTTLSPTPGAGAGVAIEISMSYFDGHLSMSAIGQFQATGVTATLDNITVPAGLINFEATSAVVADQQSNVRYSVGGPANDFLNLPYSADLYNPNFTYTRNLAGVMFVLIPHGYKPGIANRWVIYDHGYGEVGWNITGGGNAGVANVAYALANAGYVVIGFNNTVQNCYGNPQCMTDTATVLTEVQSKLSLAAQPYMFAESMGGFTMLNSIMQGIVHPRAIVGVDINTNMAWDYASGGAAGPINADYNITTYSQMPPGFDPMVATGAALNNLLIPTMLWSSPQDSTVLQQYNSLLYGAMLNAIYPGIVQQQAATGAHEDISGFNGPAVVAFFNSH